MQGYADPNSETLIADLLLFGNQNGGNQNANGDGNDSDSDDQVDLPDEPGPPFFPSGTNGEGIFHPMEEAFDLRANPPLLLKADMDSVYGFNKSLAHLVCAIGDKNTFTLPSLIEGWKVEKSSRFSVNCQHLRHAPAAANQVARTMPLENFPNVKIATVGITQMPLTTDMHIHIYFLGTKSFRKSTHFSTLWMGVVNAMLNIAREKSISFSQSEQHGDDCHFAKCQFRSMDAFHSKTPTDNNCEAGFSNHLKNVNNHLDFTSMIVFADHIQDALADIAANKADLKFEHPSVNGMQFEGPGSLKREDMVKFAKELKKGIMFSASLAGCKAAFMQPEFMKTVEFEQEQKDKIYNLYQDLVSDHIAEHQEALVAEHGSLDDARRAGETTYEGGTLPRYSAIERVRELWKNLLKKRIFDLRNALFEKIRKKIKKFFSSKGDMKNPESEWYFDIAVEIHVKPGHKYHLLTDCGKTKELLDFAMGLRCVGDGRANLQDCVFCLVFVLTRGSLHLRLSADTGVIQLPILLQRCRMFSPM